LDIVGYSILAVLFELIFRFPMYRNLCTPCFLQPTQQKQSAELVFYYFSILHLCIGSQTFVIYIRHL